MFRMKNAMGLWQAIMMILLVSGMMMIVLKYASISAKHTQNSFIREQLELYLNSAIEEELLIISLYQRSNNDCIPSDQPKSVKKRDITYSAKIDIKKYYLQKSSLDYTMCDGTPDLEVIALEKSTDTSHGMALFEVEVNATKKDGTVVSRIIRRTLQQP